MYRAHYFKNDKIGAVTTDQPKGVHFAWAMLGPWVMLGALLHTLGYDKTFLWINGTKLSKFDLATDLGPVVSVSILNEEV